MFRAVPPSLVLALAMTEPEEKKERYDFMKQHQCSELEAAFWMAESIDKARGIETLPWQHYFEKKIQDPISDPL